MTKLRKNPGTCSSGVHSQDQARQSIPGVIHAVSNLHGDGRAHIYVGGVSVSPRNPIRFDQAENIIQAAGYALSINCPLGYHLTVKWPPEANSYQHHQAIIHKIGEWQAYNIGKRVYVWSRERQGGDHSHILLHCPKVKKPKLQKMVRKWLKVMLGARSLPKGTINFTTYRKVGQSFDHIRNRVRYILKGADSDTRHFLGCTKLEPTYVEGKRAGVSQDLNRKARREAGSVLPSGTRKPTREILEAADIRDRMRAERESEPFRHYRRQETAA